MAGLDYTRADLDTRSAFAVTKERSQRLAKSVLRGGAATGCIIISTCNRTEIYLSLAESAGSRVGAAATSAADAGSGAAATLASEAEPAAATTSRAVAITGDGFSLTRLFCEALEQDYATASQFFVERTDEDALRHLARVAAGLDSQILGDDQIITQTREALELSREEGCTDSYLETFFRVAIQTAKAIKTNVILKALGAASVPLETVSTLRSILEADGVGAPPTTPDVPSSLRGKKVVVIGNGVIGRHVASLLLEEGAQVTVTVREYRRGNVQVPEGATPINYSDRYTAINASDIVISATTSNHFTVRLEDMAQLDAKPSIVVDLAVPRDVEPELAELAGVQLLTVDDIASEARSLTAESLATIEELVQKNTARYQSWYTNKQAIENGKLASTEVFSTGKASVRTETASTLAAVSATTAVFSTAYSSVNRKSPRMKIYAVGLGPGDLGYMSPRAKQAIEESDVIAGYTTYIDLIPELLQGKEVIATGMRSETERCKAAIEAALEGKLVSVICSGDAGIYGMAGLLFELAESHPDIEIEVIPGITAATAAAAILGSPLTNDFAVISLSDQLTPWEVIEKRLEATAQADMVVCLYNPQSQTRSDYLKRACDIMLRHKAPDTNCGYVRNAFRGKDGMQQIVQLDKLADEPVDMLTTVVVGNSDTMVVSGKLVTARGYQL